MDRARPDRQAVRLRRRRRHDRVPEGSRAPGGDRREPRGPRRLRPHRRTAVPHGRGGQRGLSRRRRRDRAALRRADDLGRCPALRGARGLPGHLPGLGWDPARAEARRREDRREVRRPEPDATEPHADRSRGGGRRTRGSPARPGRLPRRLDRIRARAGRDRARARRTTGSRGAGGGGPPGPQPARRLGARRSARPVPGARADRGLGRVDGRRGLSRRGGGDRRPDAVAAGARFPVRIRPRRPAREAGRRPAGGGGAQGPEGRHRRRRADGHAAGDAVPAPARGADRAARRRPGDRRPGTRLDPRGAR